VNPYSSDHSEPATDSSVQSAKEVVPTILELIQPKRVVDIGCGLGGWLSAFKELGVEEILGIDGEYVDRDKLRIPSDKFLVHDLSTPLQLKQSFPSFDLVLSLEVAEHLPSESAKHFVEMLSGLGPVILFSAAIPHQPGDYHINCQWPEYWANFFFQEGYVLFDFLRKQYWNNTSVDWWYSQNMLLFVKQDSLEKYPSLEQISSCRTTLPHAIVHPKLYKMLQYISQTNISKSPPRSMLSILAEKLANRFRIT
jgi:SAM-dependent methyltransferase